MAFIVWIKRKHWREIGDRPGQTTIMELKLFTDLIDALGKVTGGLKAIVNLPKPEREAMRKALDET